MVATVADFVQSDGRVVPYEVQYLRVELQLHGY
jgi:hypothetical protein